MNPMPRNPISATPKKGVSMKNGRFPLRLLTKLRGNENAGKRTYRLAAIRTEPQSKCSSFEPQARKVPATLSPSDTAKPRIVETNKPHCKRPAAPNPHFSSALLRFWLTWYVLIAPNLFCRVNQ